MGTVDSRDQQPWVAVMKEKADDLVEQATAIISSLPGGARSAQPGRRDARHIDDENEGDGD